MCEYSKADILQYRNVPVAVAAQYLGVSSDFVRKGIIKGALPIGTAFKGKGRWTFHISPYQLIRYQEGGETT